jgi:hypothetical protein
MIKKEGISIIFFNKKFKPFSNEYEPEPEPTKKTKSLFIDDDEKENDEIIQQRKIDPFVVAEFRMTKDIVFNPKSGIPYVRPNRGIIASINISNLIKYCNKNNHPYHEFDGGNLNDNTELITKHFNKCIIKGNQKYAEFISKETKRNITIDELLDLDCDEYQNSDSSDDEEDKKQRQMIKEMVANDPSLLDDNEYSGKGLEFMNFISKK